jgi:hypothetical protein
MKGEVCLNWPAIRLSRHSLLATVDSHERQGREGVVWWAILDDLRTFTYDNLMLERIQDIIGNVDCVYG